MFHYIFKETFGNNFFKETVVTIFAFSQSSSYITQNIIVHLEQITVYAVFYIIADIMSVRLISIVIMKKEICVNTKLYAAIMILC